MSIRWKWSTAAPLVALLAAGCTDEVTQEQNAAFLRASFDSSSGRIPTPNDLALQGAILQPPGATRTALMAAIGAGGFPGGAPSALNVINVPFEEVGPEGVGTTGTARTWIDPATISSRTVAIVRVSGTGAPALDLAPQTAGTTIGAIRLFPSAGYTAGARYVAAVRGGASGVRTVDGRTIEASAPVFLITHRTDLSSKETRPATINDQDAATLARVQAVLSNPVDWDPVTVVSICVAATGAPAAAFPEGRCWLPYPAPAAAGSTPDSQPVLSALDAVNLAFPVEEAASLHAFEIAP
jgi:hypothetical protein